MRMLVTGATGSIGSTLVPRLLASGHETKAMARDPLMAELPASVEVVRGDSLTGEGLTEALEGVDIAYYLMHSMEGASDGVPFPERERMSARRFADAAGKARVSRIVYLGGLVGQAGAASRHLASRREVERILLGAIPDSVALRSSIVIGAASRSFRLLVRLVGRMPVLALPAWRSYRTQPIDARDVTEMLVAAAENPAVGGRSIDVGGPQAVSYEELLTMIAEAMLIGRPTVRIGVNLTAIAARLAAAIAEEDPELVVPLMEGLHGDLLPADDASQILAVPLHPLDAAIEHALGEWERDEPLTAR